MQKRQFYVHSAYVWQHIHRWIHFKLKIAIRNPPPTFFTSMEISVFFMFVDDILRFWIYLFEIAITSIWDWGWICWWPVSLRMEHGNSAVYADTLIVGSQLTQSHRKQYFEQIDVPMPMLHTATVIHIYQLSYFSLSKEKNRSFFTIYIERRLISFRNDFSLGHRPHFL